MDRMTYIAQAIANGKKLIEKVETGNYTRGNIDHSKVLLPEGSELLERPPAGAAIPMPQPQFRQPAFTQTPTQAAPAAPAPVINTTGSKLPSAILESFKKNPGMMVGNPTAMTPNGVNSAALNQIANAAKEQLGLKTQQGLSEEQRRQLEEQYQPHAQFTNEAAIASVAASPSFSQQFNAVYSGQQQMVNQPAAGPALSEDYIKFLIQKTVTETVEATVKAVMTELNKPSAKINEDFQIVIGGKRFGGKLNTLKG